MKNRGQLFRWVIMALSFIFLVYGGRFLTVSASDIKLPVFACPYNIGGVIEGSCLYITEWTEYIARNFSTTGVMKLLAIFGSTIAGILVFGRLWCGYVCPFGFIQDVLYKVRGLLGIRKRNFSEKQRETIKFIKWGLMAIFLIGIGFCEICPVRYVIPPLNGITTRLEFGAIVAVIVLGLSLSSERFFCRICPLGGFMGLFHKIVPFKITKDCVACTECGICYEACPMDIREIYTQREETDVTTSDCLFCNKCVDYCPEKEALSLTFMGKKIATSGRKRFYKNHVK